MSESYAAPRSANKNKNDKESKNTGLRRLAAGLALASIGVTGGGAAVKYVHDQLQSHVSATASETLKTIDSDTKDQLVLLQATHDHDMAVAPHDVQLQEGWKFIQSYGAKIEAGDTVSQVALAAYKQHHENQPDQGMTNDIADSITITANSYTDRERAENGSSAVQPDTEIIVAEVQSVDGREYVVVSRAIDFSTD